MSFLVFSVSRTLFTKDLTSSPVYFIFSLCRYETKLAAVRCEIEAINTERSLQQTAAGRELGKLEEEWYTIVAKCIALDGVVSDLEAKREAIEGGGKE